eukprot:00534.XXX_1778_1185_1 [CDS] Oithona nana genome sequencing.
MIEEAVMNATKKLLTDELVPKVSLRLNDHVEGLVNAKDAKINHLEEKNEQLEGLINRLQQQVEVLQKGQRKVFFSAMKKGDESGEDFNGIITFNHIEVNEGGGFNKATGRFRAPVAGTYEFGFSAVTGLQRTRNWVAVFKGGSWHHNIYDGNLAHASNNIGSSWMFKLRRNEEVYLNVAG